MTNTIHLPQVGANTTFAPTLAAPPAAEPPVAPVAQPVEPLLLPSDLSEPERYIYRQMKYAPQQRRPELRIHEVLQQVARWRAEYVAVWMNDWQPGEELPGHNDCYGNGPNYHVRLVNYQLPEWYPQDAAANTIESLSYGYPGAEAAWQGWMASPLHAAHLLAHERHDTSKAHAVHFYQQRCGIGHAFLRGGRSVFVVLTCPPEGENRWL